MQVWLTEELQIDNLTVFKITEGNNKTNLILIKTQTSFLVIYQPETSKEPLLLNNVYQNMYTWSLEYWTWTVTKITVKPFRNKKKIIFYFSLLKWSKAKMIAYPSRHLLKLGPNSCKIKINSKTLFITISFCLTIRRFNNGYMTRMSLRSWKSAYYSELNGAQTSACTLEITTVLKP